VKIHAEGAGLFHAHRQTDEQTDRQTDRQTDMTKLIVASRNFANAPKNGSSRSRLGDVDWIVSSQHRDRWRAFVNAVMNLQVQKMSGIS
jgi:hypothetical protein